MSTYYSNSKIKKPDLKEKEIKVKSKTRKIFINNPVKNTEKYNYANNYVRSSVYTWYDFFPKCLLFQFRRYANIYFLFISIIQCIPQVSPLNPITAVIPFAIVLCISMIRECIEDIKRHKNDREENSLQVLKYDNNFISTNKFSDRKLFVSEASKNLHVGNIVKIKKNSTIPADMILLSCSNNSKTAYIETSNLDGEKNLKPIICLQKTFNLLKNVENEHFLRLRGKIRCILPTADLSTFNGEIFLNNEKVSLKVDKKNFLYKGTVLKDTDWALGIVVYTGKDTKIILNINKSNGKSSHLEMLINKLMILIFFIQLLLCLVCAILSSLMFSSTFFRSISNPNLNKQSYIIFVDETVISNGYYNNSFYAGLTSFFSYFLLFNTMIPISLVVTLEMVKYGQSFFMRWDLDMHSNLRNKSVEVNSCSLNEEMGQIKYIFSDKTGTLTTNKLVFKKAFIWDTEFGKLPEELNECEETKNIKDNNKDNNNIKNADKNNNKKNYVKHSSKSNNINIKTETLDQKNNSDYNSQGSKTKNVNNESNDFRNKINLGLDKNKNIANFNSTNSFPFNDVKAYSVYGKEGKQYNIELFSANKKFKLKLTNTRDIINQFLYCISLNQNCFINKSFKLKEQSFRRILTGNEKKLLDKSKSLNHSESMQEEAKKSKVENWEINYTGESPDEIILTNSIKEMGMIYFEGDDRRRVLGVLKGTNGLEFYEKEEFEILKVMEFNSERGMSSIIVKREEEIFLYSKGGDGKIGLRLSEKNNENKHKIFDKVKSCSEKGYRVLCSAMKILDQQEYQDWIDDLNAGLEKLSDEKEKEKFANEKYLEIEKGLILLGCTVVEDKLQDNVPETIKELQNAGVNIWVLTGDNLETARNIGISCQLLPENMQKYFLYGDEKKMKKIMEENLQIFIDSADTRLVLEATKEINDFQEKYLKYYPKVCFNPDKNGVDKVHEEYRKNERLKINLYIVLKQIKQKMIKENKSPECIGMLRGIIIEMACLNCILPPQIKNFPSTLYNHPLTQLFLDVVLTTQAVVCCRTSPKMKSSVVELVKRNIHGAITLAIGDGANDVSMISMADVGVGLYGEEGSQAAMASDYSMGEFQFLRKMLLFHGRINYIRIAEMILYFFFKNFLFTIPQFFFAFSCGFSGQTIYDDWYVSLYNLIFTSLPLLFKALMEQDITLEDENDIFIKGNICKTYYLGRESEIFNIVNFIFEVFKALCSALLMYFFITNIIYLTPIIESGHMGDFWIISLSQFTSIIFIVNFKLLVTQRFHTWINVTIIIITSYFSYIGYFFVSSLFTYSKSQPTSYSIIQTPCFYLSVFLLSGMLFIFELAFSFIKLQYFNNPVNLIRKYSKFIEHFNKDPKSDKIDKNHQMKIDKYNSRMRIIAKNYQTKIDNYDARMRNKYKIERIKHS